MKNLITTKNPHLALTIGDPAGIGPEIVLKALADPSIHEKCQITIFGDSELLNRTYQQLKERGIDQLVNPTQLGIENVHVPGVTAADIQIGCGDKASGAASFAYLQQAIKRTLQGDFHGIVTSPIAKALWQEAGYDYPGQTEVLAQAAQVEKFGMLFVAQSPHTNWTLRTLLATTHIPLGQVPQALNPQLMSRKLELLVNCLQADFGIETPKIVVAGLNPHSGEEGKLGSEEQDWLIPWLEHERRNKPQIDLIGPVPPDTLWVKPGQAWYHSNAQNQGADAYLALYHDQGLIPVKLLAFDQAVNTTIGLPFIRTSPDHGTAFDIAGLGIANPASLKAAITLAAQLGSRH